MKIIIIGCPGSGKSIFSQKLNKALEIPLFHLDLLYYNNDGTHISKEELERKLEEIFRKNDKWIIDGNYQRTIEMRMKECDTIILLDYPVEICLAGAESRIGKKRVDLPWIEEELDDKFKQKIISFSDEKMPQIYQLLKKYKNTKKVIVFKSREESNKYLLKLNKEKINPNLKHHIQQIIQYHYNLNDNGHGVDHAEYVINRSMNFADQVENINYEMVYTIAAYHDIAHHIDAKNHEIISAKMLCEDEKLKEFFNDEQIKIMSKAIEDHRSSMIAEPRSIYGKIVSSADRNTSVEVTLARCYSYNRKYFPKLKEEEVIYECRKFLLKKFGLNGYARSKMFFDDEEYQKYLDNITELASNSEEFSVEIKRVNGINQRSFI